MKIKERQCHITKQLVHSFSVNIKISQPSKVMFTVFGLTNPDVNLKRMHQMYNIIDKQVVKLQQARDFKTCLECLMLLAKTKRKCPLCKKRLSKM